METQIHTAQGEILATVQHVDGPAVVTVQRVGWKKLTEAERVKSVERMTAIRDMGGLAFVTQLMAERDKVKPETPEAAPVPPTDPLDNYDIDTLLRAGVKSGDRQFDDWTPELATDTARWVLKLSRPLLFETEADRKNV